MKLRSRQLLPPPLLCRAGTKRAAQERDENEDEDENDGDAATRPSTKPVVVAAAAAAASDGFQSWAEIDREYHGFPEAHNGALRFTAGEGWKTSKRARAILFALNESANPASRLNALPPDMFRALFAQHYLRVGMCMCCGKVQPLDPQCAQTLRYISRWQHRDSAASHAALAGVCAGCMYRMEPTPRVFKCLHCSKTLAGADAAAICYMPRPAVFPDRIYCLPCADWRDACAVCNEPNMQLSPHYMQSLCPSCDDHARECYFCHAVAHPDTSAYNRLMPRSHEGWPVCYDCARRNNDWMTSSDDEPSSSSSLAETSTSDSGDVATSDC